MAIQKQAALEWLKQHCPMQWSSYCSQWANPGEPMIAMHHHVSYYIGQLEEI